MARPLKRPQKARSTLEKYGYSMEKGSVSPLKPRLPRASRRSLDWTQLYGASRGLAIARAGELHGGPVLVVVPDPASAMRLESELEFFLGDEGQVPVLHFPDWETLPYDAFSPHQDIVSERLETLRRLPALTRGILVTPVTTLMVRTPPPEYISAFSLELAAGDQLDIDAFRMDLETAGYRCVSQVMEHGEYAIRGSIFDLFPMGGSEPLRVDLLDDEIESIRVFDPETQRSTSAVNHVRLLPAREFPMTEDAIRRFRQAWRATFEGDPNSSPIYRDVSNRFLPPGIEYYLPMFFEQTATLFDFLPANSLVIEYDDVHDASESFGEHVRERYQHRVHDRERPILAPTDVFLQTSEIFARLKEFPRIRLRRFEDSGSERQVAYATRAPHRLPVDARAEQPLSQVHRFIGSHQGRVLFLAESPGRRETLLETFRAHRLHAAVVSGWKSFLEGDDAVALTVAPLSDGATIDEPRLAVISETQLFGERARQQRRRPAGRDAETVIRDLTELHAGAPVVHESHGVGRYRGLVTLSVGGVTSEYLCIEYADGDKLYVPVASLHLVTRYTGAEPDAAPLHKLGGQQWLKARRKAVEKVHDVAAELLEVQARRASRPGHRFQVDHAQLRAFEQGFPFEETPDQQQCIQAVINDMASDAAMDRVVCGDVGFGKTEVAMRAAFVAVNDGCQVAILVPTTLLAQQHYQNFLDRFADWPVRIEQLSRFKSKNQRERIVEDLANGKVDIVIGTHKLLQGDIRFRRLGLAVIDEEHRFGVRQKERLKALRAETDVLTLTATPIPRTLNMALSGLRDLSLIATPPERRLSINTFVRQWSDVLLREAVLREVRRGGQVYFVHNRVENIDQVAKNLQKLVPDASVRVAHGQMRERDLERVMLDFYHRRFNVLVCTTIIETGIDVPSANTIVINRADRFGLAQLHQLRGRVGRSHHRAYAYLIVPPRKAVTADAVKRLEAIESLEDLGIGFTLATHDLEIRGAGELLGDEQSGQIHEVGYALYTRLLERAVVALRTGKSPKLDRPLDHGAEVDIHAPALIPEDYLPDVHARLIMYKRIASADSEEALEDLKVEMIDRFGLLPEPTRTLFRITALKLKATPLGIRKIDVSARGGRVEFRDEARVDPAKIVRMIQTSPAVYRLDGSNKLRISMELPGESERLNALDSLLEELDARDAA
ncbi:MAG: transcription-repair coupling factor [Gammaproteobacteria bacterium]|nr:transcription-repair coupling factor [Gammaproteobacteria bacterium]